MARRPHSGSAPRRLAFEVFDARPVTAFPKLIPGGQERERDVGRVGSRHAHGPRGTPSGQRERESEHDHHGLVQPAPPKPGTAGSNDTQFRAKVHPFEGVYSTDCVSAIRGVLGFQLAAPASAPLVRHAPGQRHEQSRRRSERAQGRPPCRACRRGATARRVLAVQARPE